MQPRIATILPFISVPVPARAINQDAASTFDPKSDKYNRLSDFRKRITSNGPMTDELHRKLNKLAQSGFVFMYGNNIIYKPQ